MKIRLHYFPLLLSFSCMALCGQTNSGSNSPGSKIEGYSDTTKYAVIAFDTSKKWLFKNAKPTTLTPDDIQSIDELLDSCIADYNPPQQKRFDSTSKSYPGFNVKAHHFVIDLSRYYRQYIPVINEKGEKEVWVNCFCSTRVADWRKQIVIVFDGGNCYFSLKINLARKTYYQLRVNGEA